MLDPKNVSFPPHQSMAPPKGRKKFILRHEHLAAFSWLARHTKLKASRASLTLETQVKAHL